MPAIPAGLRAARGSGAIVLRSSRASTWRRSSRSKPGVSLLDPLALDPTRTFGTLIRWTFDALRTLCHAGCVRSTRWALDMSGARYAAAVPHAGSSGARTLWALRDAVARYAADVRRVGTLTLHTLRTFSALGPLALDALRSFGTLGALTLAPAALTATLAPTACDPHGHGFVVVRRSALTGLVSATAATPAIRKNYHITTSCSIESYEYQPPTIGIVPVRQMNPGVIALD